MFDDPLQLRDDYLMTREEASQYARALGVRLAVSTLAKAAWRGDGPVITYQGNKPYYAIADLRSWLASRTRKRRSTRPRDNDGDDR
jgi:hypothetical protein